MPANFYIIYDREKSSNKISTEFALCSSMCQFVMDLKYFLDRIEVLFVIFASIYFGLTVQSMALLVARVHFVDLINQSVLKIV